MGVTSSIYNCVVIKKILCMYVCMYVDLVCANLISRQQSLPSWRSIFHGTKCSANNLEQRIRTAVSAYSLHTIKQG